jgi:hypothetical protein
MARSVGPSMHAKLYRRKLNLKPKLQSSRTVFQFQALSSRRFQRGFCWGQPAQPHQALGVQRAAVRLHARLHVAVQVEFESKI